MYEYRESHPCLDKVNINKMGNLFQKHPELIKADKYKSDLEERIKVFVDNYQS